MAVKAVSQVDIVDVTDAYSVILTSEAHTFPGTATTAIAGSTTTQVIAMRGGEQVPCSVDVSSLSLPPGVTVAKDSDTTSPTITVSVTTAVTSGGKIDLPVSIGDGSGVTMEKSFSYAIAFMGQTGGVDTVESTALSYQLSTSGTTVPTGTWSATPLAPTATQYLWTRTVVTYDSGATVTSYSVGGKAGGTGAAGKGIQSSAVTYQASTSGTSAPTGTWLAAVPSVSEGSFLWTRTVTTYTDATTTTSYSVAKQGQKGATGSTGPKGDAGEDALLLTISSSAGTVFRNTQTQTVLTAHVFKGGLELSASTNPTLASQGTIKWYKDGGSSAVATGQTLTIAANTVTSKATYTAKLEG